MDGQLWFGDVSAKAYLVETRPLRDLRPGRAGHLQGKSFGETFNDDTVHLGLGAEIGLCARVYLRPEVRGRWATR